MFWAVLAVLVLTGTATGSWVVYRLWRHEPFTGQVHVVQREPLKLTIVERGTLESAENSEIMCQVKAGARGGTIATTIKWVIDDGTDVKKGNLLFDLDDSALSEQLKDQEIKVALAEAASITAKENYEIVLKQNLREIESAKIAIEIADLNLKKFTGTLFDPSQGMAILTAGGSWQVLGPLAGLVIVPGREELLKRLGNARDGDFWQTRNEILGRLEVARSDLEMWQDRAAWSKRMVLRGFLSRTQAEADEARLRGADINLKKISGELDILDNFTKKLNVTDLTSKLEEARRALNIVEAQAQSKDTSAQADRKAKESIYQQEKERKAEILAEIRKCHIISPQDGLVVYFMAEATRFGGGTQQGIVAQGESVREGQKLMRIPNLKNMQVNVRVHEAMVPRLLNESPKASLRLLRLGQFLIPDRWQMLVNQGAWGEIREKLRADDYDRYFESQPASIRVEGYPNRVLKGRVRSIANVASQAEFFSSDVKVYQTIVSIDEIDKDLVGKLKPGMSAEVTILADASTEEVLTAPIQSVVGTIASGEKRKCFVLNAANEPEERDIVIGRSNEKMVEVKSGLREGDRVVLNPRPLLVGDKAKLKPGVPSTKRGGDGDGGGERQWKGKKADKKQNPVNKE